VFSKHESGFPTQAQAIFDYRPPRFPPTLVLAIGRDPFTGNWIYQFKQRETDMKFLLTLLATCMLASLAWAAEPVNVNTASAEEIAESLNGVGLIKAARIVEYRQANGPFTHVDELVNVKGIGIRTIDKNKEMILLQAAGAQADN